MNSAPTKLRDIPCKYERHFSDRVPIPFGIGDCDMPGFECAFDGDENLVSEVEKQTECTTECPRYSPVKVLICPEHNEEYIDWCESCEEENELGRL